MCQRVGTVPAPLNLTRCPRGTGCNQWLYLSHFLNVVTSVLSKDNLPWFVRIEKGRHAANWALRHFIQPGTQSFAFQGYLANGW